MERYARNAIWAAGMVFVIAICSVMLGMTLKQDQMLRQQTYEHALALHELITLTRSWNARHGGVFVEKTGEVTSNPYLVNPDITSTDGRVYTKKNPALMTREISELASRRQGFSFHITSLRPINPANGPDEWEKQALLAFEQGVTEETTVIQRDGHLHYRLMKPLVTEPACLTCHAVQGYRVGDIRGGITVTHPFDEAMERLQTNTYLMVVLSLLLLLLFGVTLYFLVWRLMVRLSDQKSQLSQLLEVKNRMLGMAAHDLRSPLTVIGGYAELLQMEMGDEEHLEMAIEISNMAQRMQRMVNGMLDASAIQSGSLKLTLQETDIQLLVRTSVRDNRLLAQRKQITLQGTCAEDIGTFHLDPHRISQVLDNLISNAIKFSKPETTVKIHARMINNDLLIEVRDQGIGVDPEDLRLLFQEYSRTRSQPTAGESTHGLGLAIVRRVVELHGGTVQAESVLEQGTTISFTLPAGSPEHQKCQGA